MSAALHWRRCDAPAAWCASAWEGRHGGDCRDVAARMGRLFGWTFAPVRFDDVQFIDAMTDNLSDTDLVQKMEMLQPDVVGVSATTPSTYRAEDALKVARDVVPDAVRVMGGVRAKRYAQS